MFYFFFNQLTAKILHVCYSEEEYSNFMDSASYSFLQSTYGSDVVCYGVSELRLFYLLKKDSLN